MPSRGLLLACLAMLPSAALAQAATCSIVNFGIFRDVESYDAREAPGTAGGKEVVAHPRARIQQTDRVPGKLGVLFGVVHRFEGIPAGGIVAAVIRHPPLPKPGGGTSTESMLPKEPDASGTGFRFDRAEEIVPGEWIFEFQHEGHVLCRKSFTVEKAD
jgi:hypothetical protein